MGHKAILPRSSTPSVSRDDVISCQWPPDPLQLELADRLDCHCVLDLHQHAGADEDLSRLCLIAQSRGDVGHSPYRGVVETPLEPDGAEHSEAVRNPDAEANLVPEAVPGGR